MLNANSFQIVSCQAIIYTPELQFRTNKVLAYLLEKHSDRLNADPISLPIPADAPAEFTRIVLQSNDKGLTLNASPASLVVTRQADVIEPGALKDFLEFALSVFTGYLEAMGCQARRVACVVSRFAPDGDGAKNLAAHFCKDHLLTNPLNRPSDFELHAAKQFKFRGWLTISSWFRCKSVNLKLGEAPLVPGAMIIQDFNSALVEHPDARALSVEEVCKFFRDAPEELQLVVNRYFPPPRDGGTRNPIHAALKDSKEVLPGDGNHG
jgi:hypothetical protein